MIHRVTHEPDGDTTTLLDTEGIDWLIQGLEQLRDMEPGEELSTPYVEDHDGVLKGVGEFVLRRAADEDTSP